MRGEGRCNEGCVTKRGITEEHALSRTRYRRVVVSRTRYSKFEPWHPSKCNLKKNAWYMSLDQNACYMPLWLKSRTGLAVEDCVSIGSDLGRLICYNSHISTISYIHDFSCSICVSLEDIWRLNLDMLVVALEVWFFQSCISFSHSSNLVFQYAIQLCIFKTWEKLDKILRTKYDIYTISYFPYRMHTKSH